MNSLLYPIAVLTIPLEEHAIVGHWLQTVAHDRVNWLARISRDPHAPAGLAREWFSKAKGPYSYVLNIPVLVGDVWEWGSDRIDPKGRERHRNYSVVLKATRENVVVLRYAKPKPALRAGDHIRQFGYRPAEVNLALELGKCGV